MPHRLQRYALACLCVWPSACSTTLDPTVLIAAGQAGASAQLMLPDCSLFQSGVNEYAICADPLAQAAAALSCQLRGHQLATVDSAEENVAIVGFAGTLVNTNVWLGGTRDDALQWTWPDGTAFWQGGSDGVLLTGFAQWAPGEPNNSSTVSPDSERCLALTLGGNDWNDRTCSIPLSYVCEGRFEDTP